MALGVTEANALNRIWWGLGITRDSSTPLTAEQVAEVQEAALVLAASVRKRLLTGPSDVEMSEGIARFFGTQGGEGW